MTKILTAGCVVALVGALLPTPAGAEGAMRTAQTRPAATTAEHLTSRHAPQAGITVDAVRIYAPPPPPAPPQANRPPTVRASCEPCTVDVGKTSTLNADATDPDGDTLSYRWSAAAGTLAGPGDRQSPWTAPMQEGSVPVTVEINDGRGGIATDAITIQVIRPVVGTFAFEDVHFDVDRYSLRPETTRALDEAIRTMQAHPDLRVEIEGHTCNIGTAEYNLALGEHRATAVREYLASRGVGADRLLPVSYGEERPKHDNAREATRRLNRRAALVVRIQR